MRHYRLSPHVYVETFTDEAVLFIAGRAKLITVNRAAAELYQLFHDSCCDRAFSRDECRRFLTENYDLATTEAEAEADRLLGFALKQRIICREVGS